MNNIWQIWLVGIAGAIFVLGAVLWYIGTQITPIAYSLGFACGGDSTVPICATSDGLVYRGILIMVVGAFIPTAMWVHAKLQK